MIKWLSLILLAVCYGIGCSSQAKQKYALLTWEYKRDGAGDHPGISKIVLVKYRLEDTGYSRTEIFHEPYMAPNHAIFPMTVYKDRYLVNTLGDVMDLDSNKFIHEHIGQDALITQEENLLYFRHLGYKSEPPFHNDTVRHSAIKKPFYTFDIKTKKITELDQLPMVDKAQPDYRDFSGSILSLPVAFSPDKKKAAYFVSDGNSLMDMSLYVCGWARIYPSYGNLYVRTGNKDSIKIADSVLFQTSIRMPNHLPVTWLNNDELLTQKENGHIIKVNVITGNTITYPPIPDVVNCAFPSRFHRTEAGEIFYYCFTRNGDLFRVNTDSQTVRLSTQLPLSAGYSYEIWGGHPNSLYVKGYYHNGKKITTDTTTTRHHKISPDGRIAIRCVDIEEPKPYMFAGEPLSGSIRIIDPVKNEEVKIKVRELPQLIGWVKE